MRTITQALLDEANASEELNPGDSDIAVMRQAENTIRRLTKILSAAEKALRSYQFGNSAPDLAEEVADACTTELAMLDETSQ